MKKFLFILAFIIAFAPVFKSLYFNWDYYISNFDQERAEGLYDISQYVKGEGASWIADEILFALAGQRYINGTSPIMLNPENPPLGKYIIGLSIYLFNNEKVPTVLFAFISLLGFYLLSGLVFESKILALVPVAIFSWGQLFQEQLLFLPLFELFALPFLLFCFYFFLKGLKNPYFFIVSHFFLGALWATRPWMATTPLIMSFLFFFFFIDKKLDKFMFWLIFSPVALIVLLGSYLQMFLDGYSLIEVIKVQKWILWYHQSRLIKFGTVFPFIFANRWYVWWGENLILSIAQWSLMWPLFTGLSLIFIAGTALGKLKVVKWFGQIKTSPAIFLLGLWTIFYLMFLSIGNVSSRYVFYLLPFCYILGSYFLSCLFFSSKKLWEKFPLFQY